jgi:hypothetical protein
VDAVVVLVEVVAVVDVDVTAGGDVLELHPANATTQATRAAVNPKPEELLRNLCVMSPPEVSRHSRLKRAATAMTGNRRSQTVATRILVFETVTHQVLHNPMRRLRGLWQQHCRLRATRRSWASPSDD